MRFLSRQAEHEGVTGLSALHRVCVLYADGHESNVLGPFPGLDAALVAANRVPAGYSGMWLERAVWERVMSPLDEW